MPSRLMPVRRTASRVSGSSSRRGKANSCSHRCELCARARVDSLRFEANLPFATTRGAAQASGCCWRGWSRGDLLGAVPGIEIVDLDVPALRLQSATCATLPAYTREVQLKELEAAAAA